MKTSEIIMNLVIVLIIIVPLYYAMRPKKIDYNKIKTIFTQYNQNNQFNFEIQLTDKRKVLGVDALQKGLLFINFNFSEPQVSFVNLQAVKNCKLVTETAPENRKDFKKVAFLFESSSTSGQTNEIAFYDAKHPYIIPLYGNEEYVLAQKWNEAIRKLL